MKIAALSSLDIHAERWQVKLQIGSRVRHVNFGARYVDCEFGVLTEIVGDGTAFVRWDNGTIYRLSLLLLGGAK